MQITALFILLYKKLNDDRCQKKDCTSKGLVNEQGHRKTWNDGSVLNVDLGGDYKVLTEKFI